MGARPAIERRRTRAGDPRHRRHTPGRGGRPAGGLAGAARRTLPHDPRRGVTIAQFPVALLGWIAVLLPAPSVTAAAGAASVGAAALIWRDHSVWMKDTQ